MWLSNVQLHYRLTVYDPAMSPAYIISWFWNESAIPVQYHAKLEKY